MKRIEDTVSFLPERLRRIIVNINEDCLKNVDEIRLRKDCPIAIKYCGRTMFVDENSNLVCKEISYLPIVNDKEMEEAFIRLCDYSVFSKTDDIKKGFITLKSGCRVGFCATAIRENDNIISVKNINSFNIRLAREYIRCSDETYSFIKTHGLGNVLIAGEPSSGKTTFLRDFARNLSEDKFNVSVIDERTEIFGDNSNYQKGSCIDLFSRYPKGDAVQIAVRTMSPDFIVTDEIGDEKECRAITDGINCGVRFVMSIHCNNYDDLKNTKIFQRIESFKRFDYIVFLKGKNSAGQISRIITSKDR